MKNPKIITCGCLFKKKNLLTSVLKFWLASAATLKNVVNKYSPVPHINSLSNNGAYAGRQFHKISLVNFWWCYDHNAMNGALPHIGGGAGWTDLLPWEIKYSTDKCITGLCIYSIKVFVSACTPSSHFLKINCKTASGRPFRRKSRRALGCHRRWQLRACYYLFRLLSGTRYKADIGDLVLGQT